MSNPSVTPKARALVSALRKTRVRHGFGLAELARKLEMSLQVLSNWERAHRLPQLEDVVSILTALGVTGNEKEQMLRLARTMHEPNWAETSAAGSPLITGAFIEFERTASKMFTWEPILVPGLAQTAKYSRALFSGANLSSEEIEKRVVARLARAGSLSGPDQLELTMVLSDMVFQQRLGGTEVMIEQLKHLLWLSASDNVHLRVISGSDHYFVGFDKSFVLFDFNSSQSIAYSDALRGGIFISSEDQLVVFHATQENLLGLALSEEDSSTLIRTRIADLEG